MVHIGLLAQHQRVISKRDSIEGYEPFVFGLLGGLKGGVRRMMGRCG